MRIQFTETRHYPSMGLKVPGDEMTVDDALGKQLVEQKFAREIPDLSKRRETKTGAEKSEPKTMVQDGDVHTPGTE